MKRALSAFLGFIILFTASYVFAACGGSVYTNQCGVTVEGMDDYCMASPAQCDCTDPGCGRNPCLSRERCCRAFGNPGGLTDIDNM